MHIINSIALISINETFFVQVISFLIFLFIINRLMFRPLRSVMQSRKDFIDKIQNEIDENTKEFDKASKRLLLDEEKAKHEAFEFKKKLKQEGINESSEIFENVRKKIAEIKLATNKKIKSKLAESQKFIEAESEIIATTIIEKILDRGVSL